MTTAEATRIGEGVDHGEAARPRGRSWRIISGAVLALVLLVVAAVFPLARQVWAVSILERCGERDDSSVYVYGTVPEWIEEWLPEEGWLRRPFLSVDHVDVSYGHGKIVNCQDEHLGEIVWALRQMNSRTTIDLHLHCNPPLDDLSWLTSLRGLVVLSITQPRLTPAMYRQIADCTSLTELCLVTEQITAEDLDQLARLNKLEIFWLYGCRLDRDLACRIPNAKVLTNLSLNNCQLQGPELDMLPEMQRLKHLELNDNLLVAVDFSVLEQFLELESLTLNGTQIGADSLGPLRGLPKLQRLFLRNTGLLDPALEVLAECPELRTLDLDEEDFLGDALLAFRRDRPDLTINQPMGFCCTPYSP